jgi:hypothetical protein
MGDNTAARWDKFPDDWSAEKIVLDKARNILVGCDQARLRVLRQTLVAATVPRSIEFTANMAIGKPRPNAIAAPFVFNGRWPFIPTKDEYLVLQAELATKGMALATHVDESGSPFLINFCLVSRAEYAAGLVM